MRSERESTLFGWHDDSAPTTDRPGRRMERRAQSQKHAKLEREKSGKKLAKFAKLGLVLSRGQRAAAAGPNAARPDRLPPGPSQTAANSSEEQANSTVGPALAGFLSNLPGSSAAQCSRPDFYDDTTLGPTELVV